MIRAEFFTFSDGESAGFRVSGHSGAGEAGYDIVCAAVSSAAYLVANAITDVAGIKASVHVKDGDMDCKIAPEDAEACAVLLKGLRFHLMALSRQYPQNIQIIDTEV
ncbi:ribosomal-processing cysteine protease Prp [Caproiciproducens sp. NJN-50]|uniref:ribosomal-processing cysteine protease Prp n=1 Tax=Acutalibacteraceae TaxID=3082771 RepID=UPI000FFDFDB4|nr:MULTISPECIES: ribosomal-processing cysteine protease Prp [Acutalibacteraceae]QAT49675.1 ribosomal-processing cysteine protease Prp [Caproiciproducens sp. NJN-50]